MRIKPRDGLIVRDPQRNMQPLPAEGREVRDTAYWRRRLRAGDVVQAPAPKKSTRAAQPAPAATEG